MKVKTHVIKSILFMFAIVVTFSATISCAKLSSAKLSSAKLSSMFNWYPKAERIPGVLVSDVEHEIVDETVVIEHRAKHGSNRWWIDVECDYWASCFVRCDGSKQECRKLAEDAKFTVNSIAPF